MGMELQTLRLSEPERTEFDERNRTIDLKISEIRFEVVAVHDKKLWREDYESFEAWSSKRHGFSASHTYRLVRSADVPQLIAQVEPPEPPEEKRAVVIEDVGDSKPESIPVTIIEQSTKPVPVVPPVAPVPLQPPKPAAPPAPVPPLPKPATPQEPIALRDRTGYPVPEHRKQLFLRGEKVSELLDPIATLRGTIRRFMDAEKEGRGDILFARTNLSTVLTSLDSAYATLKTAIPFAVCPDCQGQKSDACLTCKGSGMISQYAWDRTVSEEVKQLRAASLGQ